MIELPVPARGLALMAGLVLMTTACAHVKPEELDTRLATLRQDLETEMHQGDDSLATRIGNLEGRVDGLQSDLDAMRSDFNTKIQQMQTALRFEVPVHFAFDQDSLRTQDKPVLQRFGQVVQQYYPDALVTVEGFADPSGSAAYNLRLGERRAESVKSYLVSQGGLSTDRVRTVSYGEASARLVDPSAHGPGQSGWQNRRVVLVIDHAGPSSSMGSGD